ncbi:hypothetical protein QT21_00070, partial [Staphylococcus aureus]
PCGPRIPFPPGSRTSPCSFEHALPNHRHKGIEIGGSGIAQNDHGQIAVQKPVELALRAHDMARTPRDAMGRPAGLGVVHPEAQAVAIEPGRRHLVEHRPADQPAAEQRIGKAQQIADARIERTGCVPILRIDRH